MLPRRLYPALPAGDTRRGDPPSRPLDRHRAHQPLQPAVQLLLQRVARGQRAQRGRAAACGAARARGQGAHRARGRPRHPHRRRDLCPRRRVRRARRLREPRRGRADHLQRRAHRRRAGRAPAALPHSLHPDHSQRAQRRAPPRARGRRSLRGHARGHPRATSPWRTGGRLHRGHAPQRSGGGRDPRLVRGARRHAHRAVAVLPRRLRRRPRGRAACPRARDMVAALQQAEALRGRARAATCRSPCRCPPASSTTPTTRTSRFGGCPIGTEAQELALGPRGELRSCTLHTETLGDAKTLFVRRARSTRPRSRATAT
jgi:hypothetical protein